MTDAPHILTPDQARARFGELLHGPTRTHMEFSDEGGGTWRPEFVRRPSGLVLSGYRLHAPVRAVKPVVWRRPR